ncbi:hypothetical protein J6590_101554, partial [Homalodisca vitripennis]
MKLSVLQTTNPDPYKCYRPTPEAQLGLPTTRVLQTPTQCYRQLIQTLTQCYRPTPVA